MSDSAISLRGVSKSFKKSQLRREHTTLKTEVVRWLRGERAGETSSERVEVLRDIDLEIPRGKTVGLVGRNGSGKSTLLKLVTGIYAPTAGTVAVRGRVSALLDLGAGFHPDFTGRENIYINGIILGMSRAEIRERLDSIIEFAELGEFIDQRVRTYSSGMFMRLAFSVATHVEPEILIVDEILAVGDEHFRRKSAAKMREFKNAGRTILLVTHALNTVQSWCDTAAWIDGGRLRELGEPRGVVARYHEALKLAEAAQAAEGAAAALAQPGRALPSLSATAASDVAAGPGVRVDRLQLSRPDGAVDAEVGPEEPFDVTVEFQGPAAGTLCVRVLDGASRPLFEAALPGPWPAVSTGSPAAVAWLRVDRCGLVDGDYGLEAVVTAPGQAPASLRVERALRVRSRERAPGGLVRMPHRWTVDGSVEEAG